MHLDSYDSTLYTGIPHNSLKQALNKEACKVIVCSLWPTMLEEHIGQTYHHHRQLNIA
jgi:hypothetical protein